MEGPTPVSALIHAATMVAAGVYMLCRVFFLLDVPARALDVIAWIGGFTALLAALIAVQQNDIKRILAYSTLSQLGYMVMAVGLQRPDAGDVPPDHARVLQGAAVPRRGLGHPSRCTTSRTSGRWAGCARRCRSRSGPSWSARWRCAGVPPFSGFYSKDAILAQAARAQPRRCSSWASSWRR